LPAETFPAASLVHAYSVFVPSEEKEYEVGAVMFHPELPEVGAEEDSVIIYPVTAILSDAIKLLTETVRDAEVDGIEKEEMVGGLVSVTLTVVVLTSILEVKGSSVKV